MLTAAVQASTPPALGLTGAAFLLSHLQGVNPWIEVDGGVTPDNAWKVIEAGANALVAGSAVFNSPSYKDGEWNSHLQMLALVALGSADRA